MSRQPNTIATQMLIRLTVTPFGSYATALSHAIPFQNSNLQARLARSNTNSGHYALACPVSTSWMSSLAMLKAPLLASNITHSATLTSRNRPIFGSNLPTSRRNASLAADPNSSWTLAFFRHLWRTINGQTKQSIELLCYTMVFAHIC
jgi:hypothetical protein